MEEGSNGAAFTSLNDRKKPGSVDEFILWVEPGEDVETFDMRHAFTMELKNLPESDDDGELDPDVDHHLTLAPVLKNEDTCHLKHHEKISQTGLLGAGNWLPVVITKCLRHRARQSAFRRLVHYLYNQLLWYFGGIECIPEEIIVLIEAMEVDPSAPNFSDREFNRFTDVKELYDLIKSCEQLGLVFRDVHVILEEAMHVHGFLEKSNHEYELVYQIIQEISSLRERLVAVGSLIMKVARCNVETLDENVVAAIQLKYDLSSPFRLSSKSGDNPLLPVGIIDEIQETIKDCISSLYRAILSIIYFKILFSTQSDYLYQSKLTSIVKDLEIVVKSTVGACANYVEMFKDKVEILQNKEAEERLLNNRKYFNSLFSRENHIKRCNEDNLIMAENLMKILHDCEKQAVGLTDLDLYQNSDEYRATAERLLETEVLAEELAQTLLARIKIQKALTSVALTKFSSANNNPEPNSEEQIDPEENLIEDRQEGVPLNQLDQVEYVLGEETVEIEKPRDKAEDEVYLRLKEDDENSDDEAQNLEIQADQEEEKMWYEVKECLNVELKKTLVNVKERRLLREKLGRWKLKGVIPADLHNYNELDYDFELSVSLSDQHDSSDRRKVKNKPPKPKPRRLKPVKIESQDEIGADAPHRSFNNERTERLAADMFSSENKDAQLTDDEQMEECMLLPTPSRPPPFFLEELRNKLSGNVGDEESFGD